MARRPGGTGDEAAPAAPEAAGTVRSGSATDACEAPGRRRRPHDWGDLSARQRWAVAAALAANALLFYDQTALAVALDAIHAELGGSSGNVQWVISSYLLALAVFMIAAGRLADRVGRKRLFLLGLALFGAGSVACAAAPDLGVLIGARVVQGMGAALLQPLALAIVTTTVGPQRRGWAVGLLAAGGTSFLAIGPLLAGAVLGVASWRWLFVLTLPVIAFSATAAARAVEADGELDPQPIDWAGLGLLLVGLTALVLGVTQIVVWGGPAVALVVAGVVVLVGFVAQQARSPIAFLRLSLLTDRLLGTSVLALFTIQFAVLGVTVHLGTHVTLGLGESALTAGALIAVCGVFSPLLSTTTGRLVDRFGPRPLVVPGLAAAVVGMVGLGIVDIAGGLWWLFPGLVVFALSRPMVFTPSSVGPLRVLPEEERALASSLVTEARQLGAVFGVGLLGAVASAARGSDFERDLGDVADGFQAAMLTGAALTAVVLVVVLVAMPSSGAAREQPTQAT